MNNQAILIFAVVFSVLSSFGTYWYSDKIVLAMTGAMPIKEEDAREFYHVVENLCIAAGLPMPKIYIINEIQPNAFATGRDAKHAVIAVTRGLLEKLNRTELEGVIAHELSHIGNRDILLSTVIAIMAGILTMVANLFVRASFFGGRSRDDDNNSLAPVLFVVSLLSAVLAPIAATMIQLAISRKREFLADASGALLTRYPEGLASALEKISADQTPSMVANKSMAHLFIASPLKGKQARGWIAGLFMTHPPVEERIRALRNINI